MGTVLRDKCRKVRQFVATYLSRRELDTKGFMILKLHVVAMIIGTLSTMVAPSLQRVREKAFVAVAIAKIRIISSELAIYIETEFEPPASLAAIDRNSGAISGGSQQAYGSLATGAPYAQVDTRTGAPPEVAGTPAERRGIPGPLTENR